MPLNSDNHVAQKQQAHQGSTRLDDWITALDVALRTSFARPAAARTNPAQEQDLVNDMLLNDEQCKLSGALMRINHTGEVCAQALYTAQALTTQNAALKQHLKTAAQEEIDHLDWCRDRLNALGTHASWLNPLWFAGAFTVGLVAGKLGGDQTSLGFVVETENQVEAHLASHLDLLPPDDLASRAVVTQMKIDEAEHAKAAEEAGGIKLPAPVRFAMHLAGRVMTSTARYI